MKKAACLIWCFLALVSLSWACLADDAGQAFDHWLINEALAYRDGWEVTSSQVSGRTGAAVARKADGDSVSRLLILARKSGSGWETLITNQGAVHNRYAGGDFSVALDSQDTLILSYTNQQNAPRIQQHFRLMDGAWRFSSVTSFYARPFESPLQPVVQVIDEVHTWTGDGGLFSLSMLRDARGDILTQSDAIWLPDVLDDAELLLDTWDNMDPPIAHYGLYRSDDSGEMDEAYLGAIFKHLFDSSYAYVDGVFASGEYLEFIADTAKGDRVLLCGAYDKGTGWTFTQSTPLPEGTRFGIENFGDTLNLGGQGSGINITRYGDGAWGASQALGQGIVIMGQVWASANPPLWVAAPMTIGDNPWSDIRTIRDWTSVPQTYEAAASGFSSSGWATPNNPNSQDRLHLRAKADKNSASLGKYYNGTPVEVLEKGKEWTRVCIGRTQGYMMTRYLAFGEHMQKVKTAFKSKSAAVLPVRVYWDDGSTSVLNDLDVSQLLIIGLKDDHYLVWHPADNRFGTVSQTDLWDGNG